MTTFDSHAPRVNTVAAGWALTAVLVTLFLICALLAAIWPTSAFGQGWVALFAEPAVGSITSIIEGIVAAIAVSWLAAVLFVAEYNRLHVRS
jgi:hypothetical protein